MSYKRLTKKEGWHDNIDLKDEYGYKYIYQRLAELEDKIEQGKMLELPCKVGDTVYWVNGIKVQERKVKGFGDYGDGFGLRLMLGDMTPSIRFQLGVQLFLTKAEAEKKLKELRNDL